MSHLNGYLHLSSTDVTFSVVFCVNKTARIHRCNHHRFEKQTNADNDMAASDLLISAFAVPRELTELYVGPRRWLLDGLAGLILCKLVYVFQDISTAVSIQSLVVMAVDRYHGVVYPFRTPISTSKICKVVIPVIWSVAIGVHGVYFYTARLMVQDNKTYCTFSWAPKFEERKTQDNYFIFISVFLYLLPLCLIFSLYALIILELKKASASWKRCISIE